MCENCIYREDFGRYRCCNHDSMYYMVPTEYITDCKDYEDKDHDTAKNNRS